MQFLYIEQSGDSRVVLEDEGFRHVIKARREKEGSIIATRNLLDGFLYSYKITEISKKSATLELLSKEKSNPLLKELHIGWCIVDPKTVEKSIPMLNQTGVNKITFINCRFSQKNFKISKERLEKILISSCEQCGRSDLMELDFCSGVSQFLDAHPECAVLDFEANTVFENEKIATLLIGCEGGFSKEERDLFKSKKIVSFKSETILKSETAAISAAAKILL